MDEDHRVFFHHLPAGDPDCGIYKVFEIFSAILRAPDNMILDEFGKRGLRGAKFTAPSGINYHTFANWVQQRRRKGQAGGLSSAKGSAKSDSVLLAGGSGSAFALFDK